MLSQQEAAALLRCSVPTVKRLRLTRKLGYYKRRPVFISHEQLQEYVASRKVIYVSKNGKPVSRATADVGARPFKLLTLVEASVACGQPEEALEKWRLEGRIPFLPGSPVRVDERDVRHVSNGGNFNAKGEPEPGTLEAVVKARTELTLQMRRRIRTKMLLRRMPQILRDLKR